MSPDNNMIRIEAGNHVPETFLLMLNWVRTTYGGEVKELVLTDSSSYVVLVNIPRLDDFWRQEFTAGVMNQGAYGEVLSLRVLVTLL